MGTSREIANINNPQELIEEKVKLKINRALDAENAFSQAYLVMIMMRHLANECEQLQSGGPKLLSPFVSFLDEEAGELYLGVAAYSNTDKLKDLLPFSHSRDGKKVFVANEIKGKGSIDLIGRAPTVQGGHEFNSFVLDYLVMDVKEQEGLLPQSLPEVLTSENSRIKLGHKVGEMGAELFQSYLKVELCGKVESNENKFESIISSFNEASREIARKQAKEEWEMLVRRINP